jgi:dihydrofolate reductase
MIEPIRLSLIVAQGRNRVIGSAGQLPWRLKDDLAHFKRTTMGAPVIMGRKTWESLPKRPLPGRPNIVISRDWNYDAAEARVYSSLSPAINAAKAMALRAGQSEVFVIGGAAIYELALPLADRIYLTEVDATHTFRKSVRPSGPRSRRPASRRGRAMTMASRSRSSTGSMRRSDPARLPRRE